MNPYLISTGTWMPIKDGDDGALSFFNNHYSRKKYADGRVQKLFVGSGAKMVLRTPCGRALWAWRKYISDDGQQGLNCAVFRNEGAGLSSALILAAEDYAWTKWEKQRCFTYVDPKKIKSENPGYCFEMAGWRKCGVTKRNKLVIYEKYWELAGKGEGK